MSTKLGFQIFPDVASYRASNALINAAMKSSWTDGVTTQFRDDNNYLELDDGTIAAPITEGMKSIIDKLGLTKLVKDTYYDDSDLKTTAFVASNRTVSAE